MISKKKNFLKKRPGSLAKNVKKNAFKKSFKVSSTRRKRDCDKSR